jgi:hypothetical protein
MSAAAANESQDTLRDYLQSAARACSPPWNISSSPHYINSIAIQSIANTDGILYTTALNALLPAISCIHTLYIGTVIPRGSDTYCGQVVFNESYSNVAINASVAAAKAFVRQYPKSPAFAWYISPTALFSDLTSDFGQAGSAASEECFCFICVRAL